MLMEMFPLVPDSALVWWDTMNPWKGKEREPIAASLVLSTELLVHSALEGSVPKET